jgi:hypothetical protein
MRGEEDMLSNGQQDTTGSEIARLREQIEREYAASVWALSGLAAGNAQHAFINARLERMDASFRRLSELVGEEQATEVLCQVFDGIT